MCEEHTADFNLTQHFHSIGTTPPRKVPCSAMLKDMVRSPAFNLATTVAVVLNAIAFGLHSDFQSKNLTETETPMLWKASELAFCIFFTVEVGVRGYVFQCSFFTADGWAWNLFDLVLILLQIIDVVVTYTTEKMDAMGDLIVMRLLRVFRLVRILRLLRVLRSVVELRTLTMSLAGSFRLFFWAIVMLFLVIFVMSIYLTDSVTDHRRFLATSGFDSITELDRYYGSLSHTVLTLFQSVMGGIDWDMAVNPLLAFSPLLAVVYCVYVAFVLLAMMNVITGVFTENALLNARNGEDIYMINKVRDLFQQLNLDNSGMITWQQIQEQKDRREMQEYFRAIDVDISEAQHLFNLLDLNDTGYISADNFLNGCIRIRGPARALETMLLLRETSRLSKRLDEALEPISDEETFQ